MFVNSYYYLFDSHSRNERGLVIENGRSILLKFRDLLNVENYLTELYVEPYNKPEPFFANYNLSM